MSEEPTLRDWEELAQQGVEGGPRVPRVGHAGGHPGQAALHRRRPRGPRSRQLAARVRAVPAWRAGHHVLQPTVDHSPVRGFLHRRGVERLLPRQPRCGTDGALGGVRPRDAPRLRQRSPARRRRRRQGRCRHRLRRGHEDPLRRDPARQDDRVDDDERRGAAGDGRLHRRCRGAGRSRGTARGDAPERHPQRVHGPQHLHLPTRAEPADRHRHHRVHDAPHAEVQLDLDLRLPHARSGRDRGPGARLHAGRRNRVRARGHRTRASTSTSSRHACPSSSGSA